MLLAHKMSLQHYVHHGSSALSDFRSQLLSVKIGAEEVRAKYIHYVALQEPLQPEEQAILDQLLAYDDVSPNREPSMNALSNLKTYTFYVTPRPGTVSPWSSKATSSAHAHGWKKVKRIERGTVFFVTTREDTRILSPQSAEHLYDRMTQVLTSDPPDLESMFAQLPPASATIIPILDHGRSPGRALQAANAKFGFALDSPEIEYLAKDYGKDGPLHRNPYLEELFMFAQLNSEHCRHKQFNASWTTDGEKKQYSLFGMIRNTYEKSPEHIISAYSDNAAVLDGPQGSFLAPDWISGQWTESKERVLTLAKVETHNHPTAVS